MGKQALSKIIEFFLILWVICLQKATQMTHGWRSPLGRYIRAQVLAWSWISDPGHARSRKEHQARLLEGDLMSKKIEDLLSGPQETENRGERLLSLYRGITRHLTERGFSESFGLANEAQRLAFFALQRDGEDSRAFARDVRENLVFLEPAALVELVSLLTQETMLFFIEEHILPLYTVVEQLPPRSPLWKKIPVGFFAAWGEGREGIRDRAGDRCELLAWIYQYEAWVPVPLCHRDQYWWERKLGTLGPFPTGQEREAEHLHLLIIALLKKWPKMNLSALPTESVEAVRMDARWKRTYPE